MKRPGVSRKLSDEIDTAADAERRRIRAAIAPALRKMRDAGYHMPQWSITAQAIKAIDAATRATRSPRARRAK